MQDSAVDHDDVMQDLLESFLRQEALGDQAKCASYVAKCVYNDGLTQARKHSFRRKQAKPYSELIHAQIEAGAMRTDRACELRLAFLQLVPELQRALQLSLCQGLPIRDIARIMHRSKADVSLLLSTAKERIIAKVQR